MARPLLRPEAIREENKGKDVCITALLPSVTDTGFFNKVDITESKLVKEGSKAGPAQVAQDGTAALIMNKDKVVSGFKIRCR